MRNSWMTRQRVWTTGALSAAVLGLGALPVLAQDAKPASAPAAASAPMPAPASAPAAAPAADAGAARESGKIAWYGKKFAGRKTASGKPFNPEALTMAHKTLPFGTHVKITNPANKASVVVVVNDRGPTQADRVGDVSQAAARKLGMLRSGVINVELEVVKAAKK